MEYLNRGGDVNMDDPKRKFQGVWIPAAIWLDRNLSITEKVMLVEINSLESLGRGCFASNEHFSEFFDLSKSRVSEIISGLADKDLVRIDQIRKGKQVVERQIWMTEAGRLLTSGTSSENTKNPLRKTRRTPSENTENSFGKGDEPPSENTKESNTKPNNTVSTSLETFFAGINPQVAKDFQKLRKTKSADLTETAMQGFIREAKKANIPLEQALRTCCEQNWTGFRADWYFKINSNAGTNKEKFDPVAFVNRNAIKQGAPIEKPIN